MKKFQLGAALWAFVTLFLILTGCGQPWDPENSPAVAGTTVAPSSAQPVPVPSQSPGPSIVPSDDISAEKLGLFLVGPGKDPEFPCLLGREKCEIAQASAQHTLDEISFREILPFGRPWFFVWKEDAFQIPIRDAHFEHRVQITNNSLQGAPDRVSASFDPAARVWFVPISKLGRAIDHDPVLQQWLKLDLLLADGRRIEIKIRFRALGTLPSMNLRPATTSRATDVSQFIRSSSQWTLKEEELQNPANRPLRLWFRIGQSDIRSEVALTFHRYHDRRDAAPTGPHPEHYRSLALLKPGRLVVHRASALASKYLLSPNYWTFVELGPFEKVKLEWIANPQSGTNCVLPQPQSRTARWTRRTPTKCIPRGECFGGDDVDHSANVVETWAFSGAAVSGTWFRELVLTDAFVSDSSGIAGGVQVTTGVEGMSEAVGALPNGAAPFSCQGVF